MNSGIARPCSYFMACLLAACLWPVAAFSQINPDSAAMVYSQKIRKYLDKDNRAQEVFSFTKEGIEVYQPATDTSEREFDYLIHWDEVSAFTEMLRRFDEGYLVSVCRQKGRDRFPTAQIDFVPASLWIGQHRNDADVLKGRKIAIDPGHIGGNLETAKMEKKWVEMKANPVKGIPYDITLIEGDLTLTTARVLKKKLEAEGAEVMLTRDQPGHSAFGVPYEKWKNESFLRSLDSAYTRGEVSFEEKNFLLKKANNAEIFRRFFIPQDMKERARKINAFRPDLTVIIHYNVDETNRDWNKPTKKDFNMAFVGGSFTGDELEKPEVRLDFLRLLLTDDLERSADFSGYLVEELVKSTGVPAAMDSCAIYLKGNCLNTDVPGVFCRNLALTRMVKGTLCYGESLYQDNIDECKALSKEEVQPGKASKRVEEVAQGYFNGIVQYIKSKSQ